MWCRQFGNISYHWYFNIRSGKRQLFSVVPPTKSAQAISSIFSPKIELGPNRHDVKFGARRWIWSVPAWLALQRSKAVFLLTLHDSINDMKHFQNLYITPLPALVCFHLSKKGCLSYNLLYTKCIPCTKNIWIIFEYHDDNYEWIFIRQIFLELVPQRIFTFWILLCWTLVIIWAINMHTDISKYNNI